MEIPRNTAQNAVLNTPITGKTQKTVLAMATPRKRPSPGFAEKPQEKEAEDLESFIEQSADEIFNQIPEKEVIREIIPADVRPPSLEKLKAEKEEMEAKKKTVPRRHPRNIPKISRTVK